MPDLVRFPVKKPNIEFSLKQPEGPGQQQEGCVDGLSKSRLAFMNRFSKLKNNQNQLDNLCPNKKPVTNGDKVDLLPGHQSAATAAVNVWQQRQSTNMVAIEKNKLL